LTICGLVLHLGFCDRASFYNYEKYGEFSYTIKKARVRIEEYYEKKMLELRNPAGAIFALKNFGWVDRQEIEQTTHIDGVIRLPAKKLPGAPVDELDPTSPPS
jgi:hypothetical protein